MARSKRDSAQSDTNTPEEPSSISSRSQSAIGDAAAFAFARLAPGAGLTVNEPQRDRGGWDFVLDAAPESLNDEPTTAFGHYDSVPLSGRVQVKGTDGTPGSIPVKLSTWLQLVEYPGPAFFFVIELGGGESPERAWLLHVGREMWEDAERRKWENDAMRGQEGYRKVNHITLPLRYAAYDPLPEVTGVALRRALRQAIGPSITSYAKSKAEFREAVGFEAGSGIVEVWAPREQMPEDVGFDAVISDIEIGARPPIRVAGGSMTPLRFGIRADARSCEFGPSILDVAPTSRRSSCTLVLAAPAIGEEIRMGAELVVSTSLARRIARGYSLDGYALRSHSRVVELLLRFGKTFSYTPKLDFKEPLPIRRLWEALRSLHIQKLAMEAGVDTVLQIEAERVSGGRAVMVELPIPFAGDEAAERALAAAPDDGLFELARDTWALARAFEVEDRLVLSGREMLERSRDIFALQAFSDGDLRGGIWFKVTPESGYLEENGVSASPVAKDLILTNAVLLGNGVFSLASHVEGEIRKGDEPNEYTVQTEGSRYPVRLFTDPTAPLPDHAQMAWKVCQAVGRQCLILFKDRLNEGGKFFVPTQNADE